MLGDRMTEDSSAGVVLIEAGGKDGCPNIKPLAASLEVFPNQAPGRSSPSPGPHVANWLCTSGATGVGVVMSDASGVDPELNVHGVAALHAAMAGACSFALERDRKVGREDRRDVPWPHHRSVAAEVDSLAIGHVERRATT